MALKDVPFVSIAPHNVSYVASDAAGTNTVSVGSDPKNTFDPNAGGVVALTVTDDKLSQSAKACVPIDVSVSGKSTVIIASLL